MAVGEKMKQLLGRLSAIDEATGTPFEKAVSEIDHLTGYNDHGGAIKAGYKLLKDKKEEKIVDLISQLHSAIGHMPPELMKVRELYYNDMMAKAKKKLSPEEFKKFHGAF